MTGEIQLFIRRPTARPDGRRAGGALLLALVAVVVVATLGAAFLELSSRVTGRRSRSIDRLKAFYLAESGLAESFAGLAFGKSGNVGTEDQPAAFGEGLFWVEVLDDDGVRRTLESTGRVGAGRAILSMVVESGEWTPALLGVFSGSDLEIPPGSVVDGYDSGDGPYDPEATVPGLLATNGSLRVLSTEGSPTEIHADLMCGPDESIEVSADAQFEGDASTSYESVSLPPIEVPELTMLPGIRYSSPAPLVVPAGSGAVEYLQMEPGTEVVFQGPAAHWIGRLQVMAGARVTFDTSGGPISLTMLQQLDLLPGSEVVMTDADSTQVVIQYAGDADAPVAQLAASGDLHGFVYAPEGNVVLASSLSIFGGLVVGGLTLDGAAALHFDQQLLDEAGESILPSFLSWRIVELSDPMTGNPGADPFSQLGLDRTDLPLPPDAHADQWLELRYLDGGGTPRTYAGMESDFDWNDVSEVLSGARDGFAFYQLAATGQGTPGEPTTPGTTHPLSDLIADSSISSNDLQRALVDGSPIPDAVFLEALRRDPPMDSIDVKLVFIANFPSPDEVLLSAVEDSPLSSAHLKDVLFVHSPLAPEVLAAAQNRTPPMDPGDLATVLAAQ